MKPTDDLTIDELADEWSVSSRTIRRHIKSGTLKAVFHNARVVRISRIEAALTYALLRGHVHNSSLHQIAAGQPRA